MVLANVAKFLSVSVTDLVVKTPKARVEVKDLRLGISKDGSSNPNLFIKLHILPIFVHMGEQRLSCDQPMSSNIRESTSGESSCDSMERSSAPFNCDEFFLSVEFGHDREKGIVIQNVDIRSGEVSLNLNEELLSKKKSSSSSNADKDKGSVPDSVVTKDQEKKNSAIVAVSKYTSMIPEKICFTLPKLDVRFLHQEHNLLLENNIMGFKFKCLKSPSSEDVESTRLDIQMDFSEMHLLREAGISVVEILKVDLVTFFYVPKEPNSPIRAEIDVKLGGTQCNIIASRLKPWLRLQNSKKKKLVLREGEPSPQKPQSTESKAIMWTCTVSAPEMTIVLYGVNDLPLYHGCAQSSHVFANNLSNMGATVHMELGELKLHMADEYQEFLKESPFIVESNSGALLHVPKVILDLGKKDIEPPEEDGAKCKLVLSVDVTGVGVHLNFKRLESLVITAISFQALAKSLSPGKKTTQSQVGRPSKPSGKGVQVLKFNLERCSVNISGNSSLENTVVADPKRVNYGSQGGKLVITNSTDGTPRTAEVISTVYGDHKKVDYFVSLDIIHFSVCVNKGKQSTEVEIERARSTYEEQLEQHKIDAKVTLFDIQKAKYVRRAGGLKGVAVCSLFSAMDIAIGWEPDLQISLVELMLRLKAVAHNQKLKVSENEHMQDSPSVKVAEHRKETLMETEKTDKNKKKESIFAVDVEMLTISAVVGDGVDAMVQVKSIFSENARIGVLLEGILVKFNGTSVVKSSRMQISRIPSASIGSSDAKLPSITWDWVIQGLNVHISLPYRLELRAIDDSFEEMLRALKLVTAAKTQLIFPIKKETSKPKKPSSTKLGRVKFYLRKITADIEEEPLQGWLDEHYHLMKNQASELAIRLNFLNECISNATNSSKASEGNDSTSEKIFMYNGVEIDMQDTSIIQKLQDEIYQQSFRSYYEACQKLVPSEGSGAYKDGFQAGFKLSTSRTSLLSISATDLDLTLTKIDGGDEGMIEVVKKLDPVALENNIPFSRLYGSNILLRTGSLIVQLRDYTYPLLGATSGKCEGRLVLAQQGRFLLAAASGRILARSFHSVLQVGHEIIEQTLGSGDAQLPETVPEMTWTRMELSVMLEHVQAHVAPTDVDPGAGVQWLPKIHRSSPKVKRTGALLERVFMPCDMYFRYTRHKGGTPELKVKPLKELTFNTHNITATMTSRQFQVMLDVLTNLLFARLPKPKKNSLSLPTEDEEDMDEEADAVVPDGVEEVELARIDFERAEQVLKVLFDDIRSLSLHCGTSPDSSARTEDDFWMITGERSALVQGLKREVINAKRSRKEASSSLRVALQKAAQLRLMEKEKNKSPSYAMRISLQINKVVWSMLIDGKPFAEAEINDMIFDFDRDYKDVGVALFTTKVVVVRNCLPNTKSDMVLSPWNPPSDWGKKVMLRVDAKQGTPKDGNSCIELFQVEIYPLKIHLTETMYRMMWTYLFPEEEQDSQRRQEVWKVSTTATARRLKKGMLASEAPSTSSHGGNKEPDLLSKLTGGTGNKLRRTSSFDRTWEETVAETVADELLQAHSSGKGEPLAIEAADDKNKSKDSKKSGRPSQEEKKSLKTQDEKISRPRKVMEFQNIKISQVELLITYESSRFNLHELKLLMDTFHRVEFTGTWRRLFSRVKKHVVWGTLKSVTGMQGKKFKDKGHNQKEPIAPPAVPDNDLSLMSDNEGKPEQYPNFLKRPADGGAAAGDGFVSSVKGLFSTQRRKAKAFVLRTMRGDENEFQGDWSESDAEFSPFARQLTITKAKKLIRRHTKKFKSKKGTQQLQDSSVPSSPIEAPFEIESDSSSGSSPSPSFDDFPEGFQVQGQAP
ncbi:unnamed protein product [Linum tenue]|uniref:FMP27 GFWDK domain-containing protein n=1 Tax=Linum tenue TaxID=586396 RepID=A0AAV0P0G8_9ROSI|nr:unnamed protein product [Linum tenue]